MKIKRVFETFVLLQLLTHLGAQDFSATLNVVGGFTDYDLTFGFNPNATDGYDENFDMYAPPAPPPPGV